MSTKRRLILTFTAETDEALTDLGRLLGTTKTGAARHLVNLGLVSTRAAIDAFRHAQTVERVAGEIPGAMAEWVRDMGTRTDAAMAIGAEGVTHDNRN